MVPNDKKKKMYALPQHEKLVVWHCFLRFGMGKKGETVGEKAENSTRGWKT